MESSANNKPADNFNGSTVVAGTSCAMSTFGGGTVGDTAAYWRPTLYANGKPITSTVKDQLYYRANNSARALFVPIPQDAPPDRRDACHIGGHQPGGLGQVATSTGNAALEQDTHYLVPPTNCSTILENVIFPVLLGRQGNGSPRDLMAPTTSTSPTQRDRNAPPGLPSRSRSCRRNSSTTTFRRRAKLQFSADPGMTDLMPTYTAHADFWNTWNPAALQFLVTKCLNARISCGTNPISALALRLIIRRRRDAGLSASRVSGWVARAHGTDHPARRQTAHAQSVTGVEQRWLRTTDGQHRGVEFAVFLPFGHMQHRGPHARRPSRARLT